VFKEQVLIRTSVILMMVIAVEFFHTFKTKTILFSQANRKLMANY